MQTRSILSVIRMMLTAGLPHDEIIQTLDACIAALPPAVRNPVDNAPALPINRGCAVDSGQMSDAAATAMFGTR